MKRFCKDVKEHAAELINYEKKETIPLTYEEKKSYEKRKKICLCKKEFNTNKNDKKSI